MLMLDVKADKAGPSPLSLLPGKESGDPKAFEKLLKGLTNTLGKGDSISSDKLTLLLGKEEPLQQIIPLSTLSTESSGLKGKTIEGPLLSLLQGEEASSDEESQDLLDMKTFAPKITAEMSPKALSTLIQDAKAFLRSEISRITQVEEMPTTLKGLLQLADKVGVELSKITLEQIVQKGEMSGKEIATPPKALLSKEGEEPKTTQRNGLKGIATADLMQRNTVATTQTKEDKVPEPLQSMLQKRTSAEGETAKATVADETKLSDEPMPTTSKQERPLQQSVEQTKSTLASMIMEKKPSNKEKSEESVFEKRVSSTTRKASDQSLSAMAASATATDESVNTENSLKVTQQRPLFSSALNELLYAEEETPKTEEKQVKGIDLPKEQSIMTSSSKEPLELKINEAKQMMRHLTSDLKEAVQNYKPPFTRLKIQLNPVKFGEVDVTMIQRGNNLHINISSNTTAITTLSQNATELRTQLSQNGMGNTTMNFSDNANSEQQQQQQRQHLADLYEEYSNAEEFELMDSLEIIIPRYV